MKDAQADIASPYSVNMLRFHTTMPSPHGPGNRRRPARRIGSVHGRVDGLVLSLGRRHRAGLMMGHFPAAGFATKIVRGNQKGAVHFLETHDKGAVALHE